MITSISRIIKLSFQDFFRNFWLSFITITIIILTLISINFLIIFNVFANTVLDTIENKVDASIFFSNTATEAQVREVESHLLSLSDVRDVVYISPDEALDAFLEESKDDPEILESVKELEENPLGASIIVKAKTIDELPEILSLVSSKYGDIVSKTSFDDYEALAEKIKNISTNVRKTGLIVTLIFAFITVLIVFNTVRMAIYTHREEIGVMRLVGASNWFIKAPFYVQSILFSLISCIIIVAIVYSVMSFVQPDISRYLGGVDFDVVSYFNSHFIQIFGIQFVAIALLNLISSSIALRRYLKI